MERFMVMPLWLRHLVPWKVLVWVDRYSNICWDSVVMWKMFGDDGGLRVTARCFDSRPVQYDYCAKFCVETWCATGKLKRAKKP